MFLPGFVKKAIALLENQGYQAYVIGGAVRDYFLGKTPDDYDISTDAHPQTMKKIFAAYFTLDTGLKHGTLTVFIDHHPIEITTYRSEEDYEDFRHPKKVVFVSDLDTDLSRRDFTINAIAYNREILDRVGGISDLKNKIIRAIGNPRERFGEDPLRILRALRFAAELGFNIEAGTEKAIFADAALIEKVSKERITAEFNKLIAAPGASAIIAAYFPVILIFLPEYRDIDPKPYLAAFRYLDDFSLRFGAFFLPLADKVTAVMKRLKYSKAQTKKVTFLVDSYRLRLNPDEKSLTELLFEYEYRDLICLIDLKTAFSKVSGAGEEELAVVRRELNRIYHEKKYFRIADLKIGGRHLIKLGYKEGIGIRHVLKRLLTEVNAGIIANDKADLIKRAKTIKKEY